MIRILTGFIVETYIPPYLLHLPAVVAALACYVVSTWKPVDAGEEGSPINSYERIRGSNSP